MSKCKKVQSSCNLTTLGPGPSQIRRVVFLWRARLFALPSSQSTCSSPSLYVLGAGKRARARARARALYACSCGRGRSLCSSKRASLARVCALGAWWPLGRCLRIRAVGAWWRAAARGRRALCRARAAASCVAGSTERGVRMVRWDRRAPRADGNVAGQTGPLRELGRPARTRLRADVMRALC